MFKGDVVYTETLGQPMVILNSYQAANELLDKRPIYSDRPNLTVVELYVVCCSTVHTLMSDMKNWVDFQSGGHALQ